MLLEAEARATRRSGCAWQKRTHHNLDVTCRKDPSRVRHPNSTAVLGVFRRLSNACKHVWAIGHPRREATSAEWIERPMANRRVAIDLINRPVTQSNSRPKDPAPTMPTVPLLSLTYPWPAAPVLIEACLPRHRKAGCRPHKFCP